MTYNIQEWKNYEFGKLSWSTKMSQYNPKKHDSHNEIMNIIQKLKPDVLGLQESSKSSISEQQYKKLSKNYEIEKCDADAGWFDQLQNVLCLNKTLFNNIKFESVSISFNALKDLKTNFPKTFKELFDKSFDFSEEFSDPRCMEISICNLLKETIVFVNLHLSYKKDHQRINIKMALEYLEKHILTKYKNIILMGDFNAKFEDSSNLKDNDKSIYNYIINNGYINTVDKFVKDNNLNIKDYPSKPSGKCIDFIFVYKTWNFNKIRISNIHVYEGYESDHFPVIIDFKFNSLDNFVETIFDEHFDKSNTEISILENKIFSLIKKQVISNIIKELKNSVPYDDYDDYLDSNETISINLLDELTPFMSSKIKNILIDFHNKGIFDNKNVSNVYIYDIPDDVVDEIIKMKNN
jgi:endonuclease/exonuclease/phosphatase family metal-dependent hydrolase